MISFRVILQGTKIQLDGLLHTIYRKENDLGGLKIRLRLRSSLKFDFLECQ